MDKRAYDRAYYLNRSPERKAAKVALQKKRRRAIRAEINAYKSTLTCSCGENHPACIDFHHISDDKEIDVGEAMKLGWSIERIMKEIAKCIPICANCHRKLHYAERKDK